MNLRTYNILYIHTCVHVYVLIHVDHCSCVRTYVEICCMWYEYPDFPVLIGGEKFLFPKYVGGITIFFRNYSHTFVYVRIVFSGFLQHPGHT